MTKTSLDYAKLACDTMMRTFEAKDLPPVGAFHYHAGVFLSGMQHTWHLTGEEKYIHYIKGWVDANIDENGNVKFFNAVTLDDNQAGILLFELYKRTGDERYKTAMDIIAKNFENMPVNQYGGFWHKDHCTNQMWLDGMYMAGPYMTEYAATYGYEKFYDMVHLQMALMKKYNRDSETGLYYHAWDASKSAPWADPETGLSAHFWGRAMGWYAVAMFEIAELLPDTYAKKQDFVDTGIQLLNDLLKYQDAENGLWYQVVDKGHLPDNWTEVSCSCLFLYAMCKAIKLGYLGDEYKAYAEKGYNGVTDTLGFKENGDIQVQKVCIGTGICTYEGYISRPTSVNDLHGMGAFLLMCCEYYQVMGK